MTGPWVWMSGWLDDLAAVRGAALLAGLALLAGAGVADVAVAGVAVAAQAICGVHKHAARARASWVLSAGRRGAGLAWRCAVTAPVWDRACG